MKRVKFLISVRTMPNVATEERGSFILESVFTLPTLFMLLITVIVFSSFLLHKTLLYAATTTSMERAAYNWTNSYRDVRSGINWTGQYDPLYWRFHDDGAVQSLLAIKNDNPSTQIDFGAKKNSTHSLVLQKLAKTVHDAPTITHGQLQYGNHILLKTLRADVPVSLGVFSMRAIRPHVLIVDPTEFIRNVDLTNYYVTKWQNRPNAAQQKANAASVLQQYSTTKQ